VSSIASIDTLAKANQASIGLVVDNGAVKGGILIEAINNESIAKISADRLDIEGKTLNIKVDAANISGALTIGQLPGTVAQTSDIPTSVSDLANDAGYQTSGEVDNIVEGKGYQTASDVNGIVDGKGYQTESQVTTITKNTISTTNILAQYLRVRAAYIDGTITANQIDATNLKVKAANIDGTLSASQISVTDLNAFKATIGGFTIDNNSMHTRMGTSDRILLCSGTSARYTVGDFTSTGWSILAGNNFGVLKNGTMYAANANLKGKLTTSLLDEDGRHWGATVGEGYIIIDSEAYLTAWNPTDTEITYQEYLLLIFLTEDGNRWGLMAGGDYNGSTYIQPTNLYVKRLS
jgi:hypothetical protein